MLSVSLRTEIRGATLDFLYNKCNYFAVGTGDKAESSDDLELQNEVFRKAVEVKIKGTDRLILKCHLERSEANGYVLREVGIFDEAQGGKLFLRKVHTAIEKNEDTDVWYEFEIKVSVV